MKKVFIITLGMALALNLVGCKSEPEATAEVKNATIVETVITENVITEEVVVEETIVEETSTTTVYVSDEYLQELEFNSQKNSF